MKHNYNECLLPGSADMPYPEECRAQGGPSWPPQVPLLRRQVLQQRGQVGHPPRHRRQPGVRGKLQGNELVRIWNQAVISQSNELATDEPKYSKYDTAAMHCTVVLARWPCLFWKSMPMFYQRNVKQDPWTMWTIHLKSVPGIDIVQCYCQTLVSCS